MRLNKTEFLNKKEKVLYQTNNGNRAKKHPKMQSTQHMTNKEIAVENVI